MRIVCLLFLILLGGCVTTQDQTTNLAQNAIVDDSRGIYFANSTNERCDTGVQFVSKFSNMVGDVLLDSPAYNAGLKKGDMISAVNGASTFTNDQFMTQIQNVACGDEVTVTVLNPAKVPIHQEVKLSLQKYKYNLIPFAKKIITPASYPPLPPSNYIKPMDMEIARKVINNCLHNYKKLDNSVRFYNLGRKNFEGQAFNKFLSQAAFGVTIGRAALSFSINTPFSEATYWAYTAYSQYENLTTEDILNSLSGMNYATIYVGQGAQMESLLANMSGYGSIIANSDISKVFIKKGGVLYNSISRINNFGWAFPLDLFETSEFEVVVVTADNKQVAFSPSESNWSKVQ